MKKIHFLIYLGILSLIWACSTEKNTMLSRAYHGTTAHYNGYFNANDLLEEAMKTFRENQKEDYYNVLPILQLPNEEEVKNMYSPIDTAISKCTKVIQRHAMPSMEKPASKKEEHNRWIDENWITIGIANFYRRDYDLAFKNFEYTKKFFSTDKSSYVAEMWMARTYMEQGKFTEANYAITNLEKAQKAMEDGDSKGSKGGKNSKSSKSKKKKKKKKQKEIPPFPKKLRYDLAITRALFAEKKKDAESEIKALTKALEYAKKSKDKARINYILGQLYENTGDRGKAAYHYDRVKKYNAGYEMSFNANLKNALNAGGEKVRKNLKKMLRDTKNAEFKDQIYYTLGKMDQIESNEEGAKENYTRSAFYSTSNNRQKGMAYEKLGDMSFAKKDYLSAQKYYDSCAKVIPETYPNYEGIQNKASKLQSLVNALEIAQYEDSVQRVAKLSPSDQLAFADGVIKKMKKDEEERKRKDAIRLAALQEIQSKKTSGGNGNKFYWNNEKAKSEGFEEFKKQWGQRANEDDWRRSDKVVFASFTDPSDSTDSSDNPVPSSETTALDSLTPEMLVAKLPLSDSALQASRDRMMNAYFDAGGIYDEQLSETTLAEKQYRTMLGQDFEHNMKLLAAYQIYSLHNPEDPAAVEQKDYILINYPTSDYAGYLRDPDYFLKKKEREKLTQEAYLTDLDRYERGLYYPVIMKADGVIANEKDNPYRSKYILLKAMAQAKMTENKKMILPTLDTLIALYPKTPEAEKALEMKKIILNGYSANEAVDFAKKSIYEYKEGEPMFVLIFLTEKINNVVAKTRVVDFNKEYYGKLRLSVTSKVFREDNVILVKQFKDEIEAASYVSFYKRTRNHLLDMQKMKILFISEKNLLTLFDTNKLDEYQLFFDENY